MPLYTKNEDGSVTYTAEAHAQLEKAISSAVSQGAASAVKTAWMVADGRTVGADIKEKLRSLALLQDYVSKTSLDLASAFEAATLKTVGATGSTLTRLMTNVSNLNVKKPGTYDGNSVYRDSAYDRLRLALKNGDLEQAAVWLMAISATKARIDVSVSQDPTELPVFDLTITRKEPPAPVAVEEVTAPMAVIAVNGVTDAPSVMTVNGVPVGTANFSGMPYQEEMLNRMRDLPPAPPIPVGVAALAASALSHGVTDVPVSFIDAPVGEGNE